ncbi:MAG: hypothetical protein PF518_03280 [Spirochaetaceae bacterium]|nr:hypothetical protein [Spirochaetaceae bacterium]
MGAFIIDYKTDYNLNIMDSPGLKVDAGIKWVTGINLDLALKASYYGMYSFPSSSIEHFFIWGTSISYDIRRLL